MPEATTITLAELQKLAETWEADGKYFASPYYLALRLAEDRLREALLIARFSGISLDDVVRDWAKP